MMLVGPNLGFSLGGMAIKIIPDVISSILNIPRVIQPIFPYISVDTLRYLITF